MNLRRVLGWMVIGCVGLATPVLVIPASGADRVPAGREVRAADGPRLVSAASRVAPDDAKLPARDVPLPLDQSGIEPRALSRGGLTLVLTFDQDLPVDAAPLVRVTDGKARAGRPVVDGRVVTVPVTGLSDGANVALSVRIAANQPPQVLSFRTLQGDVNGDTRVNEDDAALVTQAAGRLAEADLARLDILGNGAVDAHDARRIRARLGGSVIGPAIRNTPPTISPIPRQQSVAGQTPPGIGFQVHDAETPAGKLRVWASSDNTDLLPNESIEISGTDTQRVLTARPAAGSGGTAVINVTVSDGQATVRLPFEYEFVNTPTLFVGRMTPQGGAQTLGSGNSTLLLSADELSAVLRFSYTNLTGPETAAHIHGPADPGQAAGILFDIDTAVPNADGSYTWVFEPTGGHSVQDQVNYIKQGKTYINIHTAAYPNGEIRGQFNLATGSQTFTPPAPPPELPSGPPTAAEAARFLTQATFGPTEQEINRVVAMGYEAWIEEQFRKPQAKVLDYILRRVANGEQAINDNLMVEGWWNNAITGEDQLRQRVAFALSQIFVVSQFDGSLVQRPREVAYYYDMLSRNAFGNYRTLLEEVTLSPAMGVYLDMLGNRKQNGAQIPNENYAREILQLFSIGLYQLHPDGTLKLGIDGLPIATYTQNEVVGFSRVFTGWHWHQALTTPSNSANPGIDYFNPMTLVIASSVPSQHEFGSKQLLDGVIQPARAASIANANLNLAEAHNQLYLHPSTGPFICKQLIQRLVTSNPSPGYVYRVTQAFNDNGWGVRGDLKAVVKAILLDYEARAGHDLARYPNSPVYNQGYGKLREPLIRATAMARAFRPSSSSGFFRVTPTDGVFLQSPMRAPTVFNFFEPGYSQPGPIAAAGLLAPEFQILNEISVVSTANFLENATRNALQGGDIRLDFTPETALAGNPTALVDRLNLLLMYGQMSPAMRTGLINHVTALPATNPLERVRAAVHLIVTSPEFAAQR